MKSLSLTSFFILFLYFGESHSQHRNNACKTYLSYLFLDSSPLCYHEPDQGQGTIQICERHIGSCETHHVTTEDGYILTLFRVRKENPRGVILIQHPISADSRVWVTQSNQSTAFLFWDAGYDVWLGNSRGTYYSKGHVNLTTSDPLYWDYSFHELGIYDLKANIDYIRNQTGGGKIIYLGHSMATTEGLVYATLRPEEAFESLAVIVNMAPIAFLEHINYRIRNIARFYKLIVFNLMSINTYGLGPYDAWYNRILRTVNLKFPLKYLLSLMVSYLAGWTPSEFDPSLINLAIGELPSEVSVKTYAHYAQLVDSNDKFQYYDYGPKKNQVVYGSKQPPNYPLDKMQVPNFMIYSTDDYLSSWKDVDHLYAVIPEKVRRGKLKISGINHVDYHYGKDRIRKVYRPIIEFLSKM